MTLAGRSVLFRLNEQGVGALKGLVPGEAFAAFVISENDRGVWIEVNADHRPESLMRAMLVKWEYLAIGVVEVALAPGAAKARVGFR